MMDVLQAVMQWRERSPPAVSDSQLPSLRPEITRNFLVNMWGTLRDQESHPVLLMVPMVDIIYLMKSRSSCKSNMVVNMFELYLSNWATFKLNFNFDWDWLVRPTNRPCERVRNGKFDVGIADDQARDFDFVAAEMKYDSTGMFHWTPSRPIEDCIQVPGVPK